MTYTESVVASANATTKLLDAKVGRLGFYIRNDSTAVLYVSYGNTAALTSPIKIAAGGTYLDELSALARSSGDVHPQINGFWDAVNGNARIIEVSVEE